MQLPQTENFPKGVQMTRMSFSTWLGRLCISTLVWAMILLLLIGGCFIEAGTIKASTNGPHTYGISDNPICELQVPPETIRYAVANLLVVCGGIFLADQLLIKPIWQSRNKISTNKIIKIIDFRSKISNYLTSVRYRRL